MRGKANPERDRSRTEQAGRENRHGICGCLRNVFDDAWRQNGRQPLCGVHATVDLENNCAFVEGEVDEASLKQAIEEAGYTYKGIE